MGPAKRKKACIALENPECAGDASANYRPSLEWARAGYEDWPAVASPAGDRPGCSTSCPTAYHDAPFTLHWYPASFTENVSHGCEVWSDAYDQPPPPPEFGPPM